MNFDPNTIKFKSKGNESRNRRLAERLTQLRELEHELNTGRDEKRPESNYQSEHDIMVNRY
jgi:hypothetical protein